MKMLIFFDIDGTLIDENTHTIPESAVRAIKRARENGHRCVINTGRSRKLVRKEMFPGMEFDGFVMGCGTMIVYGGKVLLHKTFTKEEAHRILDGLYRYRIDAVLEGGTDNFRDCDERIFTDVFRNFIHRFDALDYRSYEEAPGRFDKFYCYAQTGENMSCFLREYADLLDCVDRGGGFYEMTPKGFSKAGSMKLLAEQIGDPNLRIAAIGDSTNDIAMLRAADIGIAMGNATAEVKAAADYVTATVEEDGIERALKWLKVI